MTDAGEGFLQIQYNNLLNPAQQGDSLDIAISSVEYLDPVLGLMQGGGGEFYARPYYGGHGYPFQATIILEPIKVSAGKKRLYIYKRKLGIATTTIEEIKVYPNSTTSVPINW
jgi:hypothetical protein